MIEIASVDTPAEIPRTRTENREAGTASFVVSIIATYSMRE